jgi:hypothetical protein
MRYLPQFHHIAARHQDATMVMDDEPDRGTQRTGGALVWLRDAAPQLNGMRQRLFLIRCPTDDTP